MTATSSWNASANDGDWNNPANWTTAGGGSAPPANGDAVYIYAGTGSITQNTNQSGVTVASINIGGGFGLSASQQVIQGLTIGTQSAPLLISVTNAFTIECPKSMSGLYYGGTAATLDFKQIDSCQAYVTAGPITDIRLGPRGYLDVASGAAVTTFETAGAGAWLHDNPSSKLTTDFIMGIGRGAVVNCERKIHTVSIGGTLITLLGCAGSASTGTSRWFVDQSGLLDLRSSGNINEIRVKAYGSLTAANSPGYVTIPTITNLIRSESSVVMIPAAAFTVTNNKTAGITIGVAG